MIAGFVAESVENIADRELEIVVRLMADPKRRILCFGGWVSQVLAHYLVSMLQQVRPGGSVVLPSSASWTAAVVDVTPRDIAVVFDCRRYEAGTAALAAEMARSGANIVLFTDQWLSPISKFSAALITSSVMSPSPFDSLAPAVAVTEAFVAHLVRQVGAPVGDRLQWFTDVACDLAPTWAEAGKSREEE